MFRIIGIIVAVAALGSNLAAAIKTRTVEYTHGETVLEGYLAWDDSSDASRPAVIVVHEWWGNNAYARGRAEMLARLGYVGFAIDMYGKGKVTTDPKTAGEWAGAIRNDPKMAVARLQLGLDTLKSQPMVDADKIAAIGYCFGGTCVLTMARHNLPVLGVVSFHGGLAPVGDAADQPIKPQVLVCHGADDQFESAEEIHKFMQEMRRAGANWEMIWYGGAVHSFTNPKAGDSGIAGVAYDKQADERSWEAAQRFLAGLFK